MNVENISRKADVTRKRLIEAARDLLADEGYVAFSENKICEQAGVTRGALRYHFPAGRYDLTKELLLYFYKQLPAFSSPNIKDRILELVVFMQENPKKNPLSLIMEIWQATFADKQLRDTVKDVLDKSIQVYFNVENLKDIPADVIPYRFMFWGAVLSLQHNSSDNTDLQCLIDFLNSH